jgi:hypothetical protein
MKNRVNRQWMEVSRRMRLVRQFRSGILLSRNGAVEKTLALTSALSPQGEGESSTV